MNESRPAPRPRPASPATRVVHRSCPTCEASCGLDVEIDPKARRVLRIEGDPEDVRSRGYLCPKAYAMKEVYEDPERLRRPLRKRPDGTWEELDWDTALDWAARRLREIRRSTVRTRTASTSAIRPDTTSEASSTSRP